MRTLHRDIVSALIFSKDNKLLMGMKDPNGGGVYVDCWHIPGGGIDEGEEQIAALQREILEEVGIDITSAEVKLVDDQGTGETQKVTKDTNETVLCRMKFNVYSVYINKEASEIKTSPNDDLVKLTWVSLENINNYKITPPSITLFARLGYLK